MFLGLPLAMRLIKHFKNFIYNWKQDRYVFLQFLVSLVILLAVYDALQIFLNHSIVNFVLLLYPIVIQIVLFGYHKERSYQLKDEFLHMAKAIVYNSFESAYVSCFLPTKFVKA